MHTVIEKIKEHSFLFSELVKRDFKKKYKRTYLGVIWSLLSPLLTLLVMSVIFKHFFGRDMPHYTIYLFCGNIVFSFFSNASSEGMGALLGNAAIFTKIKLPKFLFLLSRSITSLINFALTLLVFFIFCIIDGIFPTARFLLLVYPIVCLFLFNFGVGLTLSALYVFFRDVEYLWRVFTQLLMYMSAIFYDTGALPERIRGLFYLNPVYVFIRYFRIIVLDGRVPSVWLHLLALFYAAASLTLGVLCYKRNDQKFLYYV